MIENKFLNLSVKWLGGRHAVLVFRVFPVKKVCQKGVSKRCVSGEGVKQGHPTCPGRRTQKAPQSLERMVV